MLRTAKSYLSVLIHKEHWWAEMWSGLMLASFGCICFFMVPYALAAAASTRNYFVLLPNGVWQVLLVFVGAAQIVALFSGKRWPRGCAAFFAAFLYAWTTCSELAYSTGLHPIILFTAGWIGVNMFAISRVVSGLR